MEFVVMYLTNMHQLACEATIYQLTWSFAGAVALKGQGLLNSN